MKRALVSLGLVSLVLAQPVSALAAACPGNMNSVMSGTARRSGNGVTTMSFANSGYNCTGMAVGAALSCQQAFSVGMGVVAFFAHWYDTAARTANPSGGCSFMCPGGNCFVRGLDALPVELLNFGVE